MVFPIATCRSGDNDPSPPARISKSIASHTPRKLKVGRT